MRGKAAHRVDVSADRHLLTKNAYQPRAVNQAAAQGAGGLEACDQHAAFAARQILAQVVLDAPGFAHATGRENDGPLADGVERLGVLDIGHELDMHPFRMGCLPGDQVARLAIKDFRMREGDPGCRISHR